MLVDESKRAQPRVDEPEVGTKLPAVPMRARALKFWEVIRTQMPPGLGPGPRAGVLPLAILVGRLETWAAAAHLPPGPLARLRATAYLHHDHADQAHDLVQDMPDADGALLHGILHRREPDFWNSKYWFRHAENHPVYRCLSDRIRKLPAAVNHQSLIDRLTLTGVVDPLALVDAVEAATRKPEGDAEGEFLRQVQLAETECLVEHFLGGITSADAQVAALTKPS